MRHILYCIFLAVLVTFPYVVLGITAHFQSYAVRYGHGFQKPFSYTITTACFTVIFGTAHLASLINDLQASASAAAFRKELADINVPVTIILELLWLAVAFVTVFQFDMDHIGGCVWLPPKGYHETNPQICTEWAISLGFIVGIIVTLPAMCVATHRWMAQDILTSRVWQRRRQKANKSRGIVPPPVLAPAGAVQLPPAAPPPPVSAFQMGAVPVTVQQPTHSVNPPRDAAPPTSVDIEAMAGLWNPAPQETSSVPITSAASPPPSTLPSWIQTSAMADSADEQPQRSAMTPSSPAGAEPPSQAASVRPS